MLKDLTNFEFKKFKVIKFIGYSEKKKDGKRCRIWLCRCSCGNEKELTSRQIGQETPMSCGCWQEWRSGNKTNHAFAYRHGFAKENKIHPLYRVWSSIIYRCYSSKKGNEFRNYRQKGVKVCDEWKNNVENFINWSIKNGWKKGLCIDRINNNGDYEPDNCQFMTRKENSKKLWKDRPDLHKGSSNWCAVISEETAQQIKELLDQGISCGQIARKYNIDYGVPYRIKKNKCWKHILATPA